MIYGSILKIVYNNINGPKEKKSILKPEYVQYPLQRWSQMISRNLCNLEKDLV